MLHACAQGLHLPAERILISPRLLADLATYAAGKQSCIKAVVKLLPELCQVLLGARAHPSSLAPTIDSAMSSRQSPQYPITRPPPLLPIREDRCEQRHCPSLEWPYMRPSHAGVLTVRGGCSGARRA